MTGHPNFEPMKKGGFGYVWWPQRRELPSAGGFAASKWMGELRIKGCGFGSYIGT